MFHWSFVLAQNNLDSPLWKRIVADFWTKYLVLFWKLVKRKTPPPPMQIENVNLSKKNVLINYFKNYIQSREIIISQTMLCILNKTRKKVCENDLHYKSPFQWWWVLICIIFFINYWVNKAVWFRSRFL